MPSNQPENYQQAAVRGLGVKLPDLEVFENQFVGDIYLHTISIPEFTSMCPKTGQPDFATITIQYVANAACMELKALKMYMQAYRSVGIFYENLVNRILEDIVAACDPLWLRVTVSMTPRGGISSVLRRESSQLEPVDLQAVREMAALDIAGH